jgi:hypothetical protein
MGIRSTREVTREEAIYRIQRIDKLALNLEYMLIEEITNEDRGLGDFVMEYRSDHVNINKYTDTMLEDIMDLPFYRYSMFDNYLVIKEK